MTRYERASAVTSATFDGEVTLLEPRTGLFFGLEEVGARVWQLLEPGATLDELVAVLVDEYEVEPGVCRVDVTELLDALVARGLVTPAVPPP